jgi:hypothetical protein
VDYLAKRIKLINSSLSLSLYLSISLCFYCDCVLIHLNVWRTPCCKAGKILWRSELKLNIIATYKWNEAWVYMIHAPPILSSGFTFNIYLIYLFLGYFEFVSYKIKLKVWLSYSLFGSWDFIYYYFTLKNFWIL